jgi:predicted dipeptidase
MNALLALVLAAALPATVVTRYDEVEAKQLVPLLSEVIRFPTYEGNTEAHAQQKAWLLETANDLGFIGRDAGKVVEIELPAPVANAPVLGLVVHGDVVPVDADAWHFPPFEGRVENGYVLGRGSVDDKGPLVQALMAMKALRESGVARTHTIRLLVGSEEESSATEMKEYLETHAAPDYSLVLDSEFPVIVGEKAWDALTVAAALDDRDTKPYRVELLEAGLAASIVPERAEVKYRWKDGAPSWGPIVAQLRAFRMPEGTRLVAEPWDDGSTLRVIAYGQSAHAGMNLSGGRNALVALARAVEPVMPRGGAADLLAFARLAGKDLHGTGLGITDNHRLWGRYAVNVATIKDGKLTINLRRIPPRTAAQIKAHLETRVAKFNKATGAVLKPEGGYFEDEPFFRDPASPLVKRLLAAYVTATGARDAKPAIAGGGTYAKRLPNAIAFGMWFPGSPYPGHDLNEKTPIEDLHRGTRVLIHAITDIATRPKMEKTFE